MKKLFAQISIALLLSTVLFSCKPSVEGELEDWEANKAKVVQVSADYPGFAKAIEAQYALATTAMEKAQNLEDIEQKAEAMEAANEMISDSFIGKLGSFQSRIERIGNQQDKLGSMRMKTTVVKKAETALERSFKALRMADSELKKEVGQIAEAETLIGDLNSELIGAEGRLNSAIRSAKKSMKAKKSN